MTHNSNSILTLLELQLWSAIATKVIGSACYESYLKVFHYLISPIVNIELVFKIGSFTFLLSSWLEQYISNMTALR